MGALWGRLTLVVSAGAQAAGGLGEWARSDGHAAARERRLLLVVVVALTGLVAALGWEVRNARQERTALQAQVTAVANEASSVRVALTQAETTSSEQEASLTAIQATLEAQRQEAAALRGRLARERVLAAQLRAEIGEQLATSAQRQQASGQEIAALTTRSGDQQRQIEEQQQQLAEREANLAHLNEQVETMTQRVAEMEALAGRLRQMLGLPVARGPAGGDEPLPAPAGADPADAGQLEARLADLTARSDSATRELATLERSLQQRIANLRALTVAGRPRLSAAAIAAAPIGRPVQGSITSEFGMRESPFDGAPRFHGGVDIATNMGTPIQATREGVVTLAGAHGSYGLAVIVRHAGGFETLYGHNSAILVRPGQTVARGQILARSGNTGASTGPHLHYEVHYNGATIDPAPFLRLKAD